MAEKLLPPYHYAADLSYKHLGRQGHNGYSGQIQKGMMKTRRVVGLLLFLCSITLAIFPTRRALALTGAQYLSEAKVPLASARQIALKAWPGKIVSEELEQESGGSGLRYSFVIQHEKVKHEVGVDAKTGQVLENSIEGGNPD